MNTALDSIRRLQLDLAKLMQSMQVSIPTGWNGTDALKRMQVQQELYLPALREITQEIDRRAKLTRAFDDLAGIGPAQEAIAALREEQERWRALISPAWSSAPLTALPTLALGGAFESVLPYFDHPSIYSRNDDLVERLLGPFTARALASTEAIALLSKTQDVREQRALSLALEASSTEAMSIALSLSKLVAIPPAESSEQFSSPSLNLPLLERQELLTGLDDERLYADEAVTILSPSFQVGDRGRRIVDLVVQINESCKTQGRAEMFKPTTRLLWAVSVLGSVVAVDEKALGVIIDALYFLIYEGAGTDHLRFLIEQGGVLTPDECAVLWRIKRIRNWNRHDIDHGDVAEVKKKWRALGEDLAAFGIGSIPTTEADFRNLQVRLFAAADELLNLVISRLR